MNTFKWLAVGFVVVLLSLGCYVAYKVTTKYYVLPWERAAVLYEKIDTIEVSNIQWACDCAEWGIIGEAVPDDELEHYSIFIEAAPGTEKYEDANIKAGCWAHKLKLVGSFYQNKGISIDYDIKFEKPKPARVFRYMKYEVTDVWCGPDDDA